MPDAPLAAALDWLRRQPDVRYAEVRFVEGQGERLRVRDGRPEQVTAEASRGVGVRVLGAKTWGFACAADVSEGAVLHAAQRALAIARASAAVARAPVAFPEGPAARGTYATRLGVDPFTISLETKLAALDGPVRALREGDKRLQSAEAWMDWARLTKRLLTTEGTDVTQSFTYGACGMHVFALGDDGVSQRRSYPTWQGGDGFQAGYERVAGLDLAGNVDRVKDEALALLVAPPCPAGTRTVLLESSQVGLQIHESCGHPTELDRALGVGDLARRGLVHAAGDARQASLRLAARHAGRRRDERRRQRHLRLGRRGRPRGQAPARRARPLRRLPLVARDGRGARARLHRHDARGELEPRPHHPHGERLLEPGDAGTLEDLVADTDDGLLVATDKSWSIDDLRLNFQFSCEIAWEIKHGKRTRILRDPFYTGITPRFWGSCDAMCDAREWRLWGVNSCGKGDPMQIMHVGHGASPARFRDVTVGSAS